jgi:hypothetical protein
MGLQVQGLERQRVVSQVCFFMQREHGKRNLKGGS